MFKNYLLIAFRNFRRNKIFAIINVLGLSIGISAALVIFLIVQFDFSFDHFEKEGDRIYRIVSDYSFQDNPGHTRGIPGPLAEAVKKEVSGIEHVVSFRYYGANKTAVPGADPLKPATFKSQQGIIFADAHYFQILPYTWLAGDPSTSLSPQKTVVLNETRAKLYFPQQSYASIIGKKIIYDDTLTVAVTGVVQDLEEKGRTDFNFKEFISLTTILENNAMRSSMNWDNWGSTTSDQQLYVKLGAGTTATATEARLKVLFEKYKGEDAKKNNYTWAYNLQPLSDIHFNSQYGGFDIQLASKPVLYALIMVAVFLLLLGCINFINLATAQASQRAREIGIRKTMGSTRKQLVVQFLSETFLMTLVSTILSVILAPLLLNAFSDFIPKGLVFSVAQPAVIVFLGLLLITVSVLAGLYPGLVLSSWNPVRVLKNQAYASEGKTRRVLLRQVLTVSQFSISQFFVLGALLVGRQIHFMMDKDMGFKKQAIVSVDVPDTDTSVTHRRYVLSQMQRVAGVDLVSLGNDVPSSFGWWTTIVKSHHRNKEDQVLVEIKAGDSNYLKIFQIPLLAGRNLLPSDTIKEILINETFLHVLGFKQPADAINSTIDWDGKTVPVVGVVRDFHAHPLNYKIAPMMICQLANQYRKMVIGFAGEKEGWKKSIAGMEQVYKKAYPEENFSYSFLDEKIAQSYDGEQKISNLLKWTTGLTIFISCLGLLGLVVYTTNLRTKEIGVRKVLGASVSQIVSILSKDFIKLVTIAFIIATPLAWWAFHAWLDNFAFRAAISSWVFLLGGTGMIAIALLTVSFQTIRAARANPVESLRSE